MCFKQTVTLFPFGLLKLVFNETVNVIFFLMPQDACSD